MRCDLDVEAALAARHEDRRVVECARVDDRRQLFLLTERADPAHHVAGQSFGDGSVQHLGALGSERGRDRFQRQVPRDRNDADGVLDASGHLDEKGFEDPSLVDPECGGGRLAVTGLGGDIVEGVHRERDSGLLEGHDGGGATTVSTFRCGRRAHDRL